MKFFIILSAFVALATASQVLDKLEVNPEIDSAKLVDRISTILTHKYNGRRAVGPKNAINDAIIEMIEGIRDQIENGFPDIGLPPLDPFELEELDVTIAENFIFRVNILLRDMVVTGLKDFIISHINFRILGLVLEYEFIVPQLDYTSLFDIDGKVAQIISVNAGGRANIGLTNFITWGNVRVTVGSEGYLRLVSFDIDFDADKFSVYLEGLFENGQINNVLNWVLENLTDDFFEGQREGLKETAQLFLFDIIAEIVSEIKLSDILG